MKPPVSDRLSGVTHAPTLEELVDEQRRMRRVRFIVDFTTAVLLHTAMSRTEAEEVVATARETILKLFPGREETYEILYSRRFGRLIETRPS
jgi:hypothetical protein